MAAIQSNSPSAMMSQPPQIVCGHNREVTLLQLIYVPAFCLADKGVENVMKHTLKFLTLRLLKSRLDCFLLSQTTKLIPRLPFTHQSPGNVSSPRFLPLDWFAAVATPGGLLRRLIYHLRACGLQSLFVVLFHYAFCGGGERGIAASFMTFGWVDWISGHRIWVACIYSKGGLCSRQRGASMYRHRRA